MNLKKKIQIYVLQIHVVIMAHVFNTIQQTINVNVNLISMTQIVKDVFTIYKIIIFLQI